MSNMWSISPPSLSQSNKILHFANKLLRMIPVDFRFIKKVLECTLPQIQNPKRKSPINSHWPTFPIITTSCCLLPINTWIPMRSCVKLTGCKFGVQGSSNENNLLCKNFVEERSGHVPISRCQLVIDLKGQEFMQLPNYLQRKVEIKFLRC